MFLAFIILVNSNTLNAQIKFKGEPSKNKSLGSFGGINFEKELLLFNSKVPIDRNSIYYGWSTNTNIKSTGNPNAQKGGMITILGDQEFPSTFRSIGKDSRNQILSLLCLNAHSSGVAWGKLIASQQQILQYKELETR